MTARMRLIEIREEEYERGEYDTKIATARNLLAMKILSDEQIAQATKLPVEEVESLR